MPEVIEHPLIDDLLAAHAERALGQEDAWSGYRGHAHRVFNLARSLAPPAPDLDERLAVVAAFHDVEAFASLDYLAPSIDVQTAWLERHARGAWVDELAHVSAFHHKPSTYRGRHEAITEAFRRADWCDVTFGRLRNGLDPGLVREVGQRWSVSGFLPQAVLRATARWVPRHPLDPAPFMRGRRALERAQLPR